jgi:hypothetical protein
VCDLLPAGEAIVLERASHGSFPDPEDAHHTGKLRARARRRCGIRSQEVGPFRSAPLSPEKGVADRAQGTGSHSTRHLFWSLPCPFQFEL